MNIRGIIPRTFKAHGSLILTILSGVGFIGTVILTAKAAPRVNDELAFAKGVKERKEFDRIVEEEYDGDRLSMTEKEQHEVICRAEDAKETKLTFGEKFEIAAPHYLPAFMLGLGSLVCLVGVHITNMRAQAGLMTAYAALEQSYLQYRGQIREEYGIEADKRALMASQEECRKLRTDIQKLEKVKDVCTFGISTIPGFLFRSTKDNIDRAFLHFNRNLHMYGGNNLLQLYSFLGLPTECAFIFNPDHPAEDYGWTTFENEITYGASWVDYSVQEVTAKDGPVYMLDFPVAPYYLPDLEEYGSMDHVYPDYKPEVACEYAKKGLSGIPMLVDPEHVVYTAGLGGTYNVI